MNGFKPDGEFLSKAAQIEIDGKKQEKVIRTRTIIDIAAIIFISIGFLSRKPIISPILVISGIAAMLMIQWWSKKKTDAFFQKTYDDIDRITEKFEE